MTENASLPCPRCGESTLMHDGIVRWRSGPCPPRSLTRPSGQLGTSPRADYDEAAYDHCPTCGTELVG